MLIKLLLQGSINFSLVARFINIQMIIFMTEKQSSLRVMAPIQAELHLLMRDSIYINVLMQLFL